MTAFDLGAKAIITATMSGFTARMVSKFRPQAPIIAITTSEEVQRRMLLNWGVTPLLAKNEVKTTDGLLELVTQKTKECGYIEKDDLAVVTAGIPAGESAETNVMKIYKVK